MSAFTVNKDHIDLLVSFALNLGGALSGPPEGLAQAADSMGADWWGEYFASVNFRYSESEETPEYSWVPVAEVVGIPVRELSTDVLLQAYQAARCFEYQSCEHPGWEDSRARQGMRLIEGAIEAIFAERGIRKYVSRLGDERYPIPDRIAWEWSREVGFGQVRA